MVILEDLNVSNKRSPLDIMVYYHFVVELLHHIYLRDTQDSIVVTWVKISKTQIVIIIQSVRSTHTFGKA